MKGQKEYLADEERITDWSRLDKKAPFLKLIASIPHREFYKILPDYNYSRKEGSKRLEDKEGFIVRCCTQQVGVYNQSRVYDATQESVEVVFNRELDDFLGGQKFATDFAELLREMGIKYKPSFYLAGSLVSRHKFSSELINILIGLQELTKIPRRRRLR